MAAKETTITSHATNTDLLGPQDQTGQGFGRLNTPSPEGIQVLNEIMDYFTKIKWWPKRNSHEHPKLERSCGDRYTSILQSILHGGMLAYGNAEEGNWGWYEHGRMSRITANLGAPTTPNDEWRLALEMMQWVIDELLEDIGLQKGGAVWRNDPTQATVMRLRDLKGELKEMLKYLRR